MSTSESKESIGYAARIEPLSGLIVDPKTSLASPVSPDDSRKLDWALSQIALSLEVSEKSYIMECDDGRSAWQALADVYDLSDSATKMSRRAFFMGLMQSPSERISRWSARPSAEALQCASIGIKLDDDDKITPYWSTESVDAASFENQASPSAFKAEAPKPNKPRQPTPLA
ncbi:MAG: hypothetical protein CYPHOPRED_003974, partial [Cyphobasidiales sp. Tagirdzhanova-0007]